MNATARKKKSDRHHSHGDENEHNLDINLPLGPRIFEQLYRVTVLATFSRAPEEIRVAELADRDRVQALIGPAAKDDQHLRFLVQIVTRLAEGFVETDETMALSVGVDEQRKKVQITGLVNEAKRIASRTAVCEAHISIAAEDVTRLLDSDFTALGAEKVAKQHSLVNQENEEIHSSLMTLMTDQLKQLKWIFTTGFAVLSALIVLLYTTMREDDSAVETRATVAIEKLDTNLTNISDRVGNLEKGQVRVEEQLKFVNVNVKTGLQTLSKDVQTLSKDFTAAIEKLAKSNSESQSVAPKNKK